ncbi:DUF6191 domain-containing protein [Streptomyces daliensis]
MFNLIEQIFSPGRRHTEDERRRRDHTRVEAGSSDPGKGPIDLASGQVRIRRSDVPAQPPPDGESRADERPRSDEGPRPGEEPRRGEG